MNCGCSRSLQTGSPGPCSSLQASPTMCLKTGDSKLKLIPLSKESSVSHPSVGEEESSYLKSLNRVTLTQNDIYLRLSSKIAITSLEIALFQSRSGLNSKPLFEFDCSLNCANNSIQVSGGSNGRLILIPRIGLHLGNILVVYAFFQDGSFTESMAWGIEAISKLYTPPKD